MLSKYSCEGPRVAVNDDLTAWVTCHSELWKLTCTYSRPKGIGDRLTLNSTRNNILVCSAG